MNYKELRIENWVKAKGEYFQISGICEAFPNLDTIKFGAGVITWKDIEPIPLTEEILLKAGFKRYGKDGVVRKCILGDGSPGKHREYIKFTYIGCYYINYDNYNVVIYYVHQLQNLYFALTGEELEIKL
jgi:hypothetical protein